jgi:Protein of unknown function (DUF4012)
MKNKNTKFPKIKEFEKEYRTNKKIDGNIWFYLDWLSKESQFIPKRLIKILKQIKLEIQYFINKYVLILLLVSVIIAFWSYQGLQYTKIAVNNINSEKTFFIEKIRNIIVESRYNQIQNLNELQFKLESNLLPVSKIFFFDGVVKNDLSNISSITKKWLKSIDSLSKYKLTPNGMQPTLFLNRTFSQDVSLLLDDLPQLIKETKQIKDNLWYYQIIGSNQIKKVFEIIDEILELGSTVSENKDGILKALGHFEPKKIVLFNQNTGEARPTGGFIGSYIPFDINKGNFTIGQSQSIYFIDGGPNTTVMANPLSWYYGWYEGATDIHGIRNSNYFSCFPDTARHLEREFSQLPNGFPIDEVIFITPQLLLGFIPNWQTIDINGESIPKNALLDKIEKITALEIEDSSNPKKALSGILSNILEQLPEIIKNQNPIDILNYLQDSLQARNLQIWFKDQDSQKLLSKTKLSGENTCANQNNSSIVAPFIINLSGDKRNLISKNEFEINQKGNQYYLNYTQTLPTNAEERLQRSFDLSKSINFVGIQIPGNSKNIQITSPQSLSLPFVRSGYEADLMNKGKTMVYPKEIKSIVKSSYNLYDEKGFTPGFSYIQPDGSQVIGLYVRDELRSNVEFLWEMPDNKDVIFYGQPGLNQPKLKFGNKFLEDPIKIQSGVKL